jgi:hypothetical protein
MFKRRTLFVIGAGASQEAGFPVGTKLARQIGENLKIIDDNFERAKHFADQELFHQLQRSLGQDAQREFNNYCNAAQLISSGITLCNSIDDFLNIHSRNPYVTELAKASIVRVILQAERDSNLYIDTSNIYNKLAFDTVEETWFVKLMRVLGPGGTPQSADAIFKNISFIVFNYDRCLEHFLANALADLYGITAEDAVEIVNKITIIHPYGKIAGLEKLPFGGHPNNTPSFFALTSGIKTYTERYEEGEELEKIHREMHNAACIVFLGFSYLEQNMALLKPTNPMDEKTVLGTAFGMYPTDRDVVVTDILKMFGDIQRQTMRTRGQIVIDTEATCAKLFNHYARTLNAA